MCEKTIKQSAAQVFWGKLSRDFEVCHSNNNIIDGWDLGSLCSLSASIDLCIHMYSMHVNRVDQTWEHQESLNLNHIHKINKSSIIMNAFHYTS